jgi:transcriptional regulator with XRE-family HTH domain
MDARPSREAAMQIRLREWRLAKVMTQEELAQRSGLTETTISRIESSRSEARISTVRKLAEALEISPQELIAGPAEGKAAA